MESKRICFRTDGSAEIGFGHVVRCISLALMIKEDYKIFFFPRRPLPQLGEMISSNGFDSQVIDDENEFLAQIGENDIVVIDGYHFSTEYQRLVKATGALLVSIDDLHDKTMVSDLIINHVPGVTESDYDALPGTKFALGIDYALLRPLFLSQAQQPRVIERFETVLICFGGSDIKNLTIPVLQCVRAFKRFKKIIVVTGAGYQHKKELLAITGKDKLVHHYNDASEQDMLSFMLEAELAIVPASGVLYESIAAGNIVITGMYVDNQKVFLQEFSKLSNIYNCVNFKDDNLQRAMNNVLSNVPGPVKKNIDGRSGARLKKIFAEL